MPLYLKLCGLTENAHTGVFIDSKILANFAFSTL